MNIQNIIGRKIYNSRGDPTIEVDVYLGDGSAGRASAPCGTTKNTHGAQILELNGEDNKHPGADIILALDLLHSEVKPALCGVESWDQFAIDRILCELDGTPRKSRLGANVLLATSIAAAKAHAAHQNIPLHDHIAAIAGTQRQCLPMPIINLMDGGQHAPNKIDFQALMIIPVGAKTLPHAIEMSVAIKSALRTALEKNSHACTTGDEGGFAPSVSHNKEAIELILQAIQTAGYTPGTDVTIAIDVAASELHYDNEYFFKLDNVQMETNALIQWYSDLCADYPISILEDPLHDQDWAGWSQASRKLSSTTMICADSLTVSNTDLIDHAISGKVAAAIVVKPVQIGTLTETIRAVQLSQLAGLEVIMSHRSRETEDIAIVHLAVGLGCSFIKAGALERGERTIKYNELLRIAEFRGLPLAQPKLFQKQN